MKKPEITEQATKAIRCYFTDHDIKQLLTTAACVAAGINELEYKEQHLQKPPFNVRIEILDAEEGSPPYKRGHKAAVTIVQDLLWKPPPDNQPTVEEIANDVDGE